MRWRQWPTTSFAIELCAVGKLQKFFRIKVLGAIALPHFLTPSSSQAIVQVHPSLSCLLFSFHSQNSMDILLCELIAQTLQEDQWDILEWVLLVAFRSQSHDLSWWLHGSKFPTTMLSHSRWAPVVGIRHSLISRALQTSLNHSRNHQQAPAQSSSSWTRAIEHSSSKAKCKGASLWSCTIQHG